MTVIYIYIYIYIYTHTHTHTHTLLDWFIYSLDGTIDISEQPTEIA